MDERVKGFLLLGVLSNVILSIGSFSLVFSPVVFIICGVIGAVTFPRFAGKSEEHK